MHNATDSLKALKIQQKELNKVFTPVFYRLSDSAAKKEFEKLLLTPGLSVTDNIPDQINEFLKIKFPDQRFSTEDLEEQTKELLGGMEPDEYGVWVYYPWSGKLVHILDEEEFIDVRTSRNQYKITPDEKALLRQKKIGVVGLSVGQSVAVTLAMERICGEIRLADFDTLELTNLNRIRTGIHNLGLLKVNTVAREISEIDPFLKVVCFADGLTEQNMDDFFTKNGKLDLLIEESDGFDIKILSRFKARSLKIPVLMEASDRCMVDVERFDLEPNREILHGIVKELDVDLLKSLKTNEEKIPYMLDVLGLETTSARLKASMIEMHQTVSTWPQLASAVTMGGGITADVSRRILLNHYKGSGRFHIDIEELIGDKKTAAPVENKTNAKIPDEQIKKIAVSYPAGKLVINKTHLNEIIEAAAQAPSYANLQPWKWVCANNSLLLFCDREYNLAIDPANMSLWVSMGCSLQNAIIRAHSLNYDVDLKITPGEPDKPLAALYFKSATNPEQADLAVYISKRHTHRGTGTTNPLSSETIEILKSSVKNIVGAELKLISVENEIATIAGINGAIERLRLLNPVLHQEFFEKELKLNAAEPLTEGISTASMKFSPGMETAYRVISDQKVSDLLSQWEKGILFEKDAIRKVRNSSAIGMITMPSDSIPDLVKGGMAAETLWLTTTKLNLSLQPICLSLYLLSENPKFIGSFLSEKNISALRVYYQQLSLIFSEIKTKKAIFLFRIFEAQPTEPSLKKSAQEIFLNC